MSDADSSSQAAEHSNPSDDLILKMLVCKIKIPHVAHNGVHISSVRTPRANRANRVQRGQSQALIHLEEFGISAALLNKTYQSIIIVVDILLVDAADPEDVKLWYVEDEGPRFPVVDPDGAVLLMREWKALQTNQQYQTMDAMDAVVTKHRTIDLRVEKIVVVVHWIGMDTNSQATVNVNARVYYKEETLPPPPRALPAERLIGS